MKHTRKMKSLLDRIATIERMERGKLCQMGERPHYNHQTWQEGRNVVRYVPANEMKSLQEAISGYNQFLKLVEQYADEVIRQTRRERKKASSKSSNRKKEALSKAVPKD